MNVVVSLVSNSDQMGGVEPTTAAITPARGSFDRLCDDAPALHRPAELNLKSFPAKSLEPGSARTFEDRKHICTTTLTFTSY